MFNNFFRNIIINNEESIVVCDLEFKIIYMNHTAKEKYKEDLVGKNLKDCHNEQSNQKMLEILEWFKKDSSNNRVFTHQSEKSNKDTYMVAIRDINLNLIGFYEQRINRNVDKNEKYLMN